MLGWDLLFHSTRRLCLRDLGIINNNDAYEKIVYVYDDGLQILQRA